MDGWTGGHMDKQTGGQTHLAAVGVFHDEAEAVAGLEGVFQCLQGGTRGMRGGQRPQNGPKMAPKTGVGGTRHRGDWGSGDKALG